MSLPINIGDFLTKRAELNPDKEALYDATMNKRFSYRELNARANQVCHALQSLGLKHGDRLALLAFNGHEYIESFFGPAKAGMVIMPLNWRLTAKELSFILKDGGAKVMIYHAGFSSIVDELRAMGEEGSTIEHWICINEETVSNSEPDLLDYESLLSEQSSNEPGEKADADDMLFIMYTSGTTGLPKGVVHTHETQLWAVLTIRNTSDGGPSDRYLVLLPLFHVGALTPMIVMLYVGCSLVINREFDPVRTWQQIESEKITTTLAVPAMLNFMLQVPNFEQFDWSSIRWMMSGAAPVPVSTIEKYQAIGIEIHQVYGLTETCAPACLITTDDANRKKGSTGRAFFHTEVKVVDDDGNELPPGEAGEVLIRGRHIMREYWNRPDASAEALKGGWLHSGDIAIKDDEGFIFIQDRKKDMVISGGENVYPAEVENVLLQHPGVADAAVIGHDSEKWGESPFAVIVKADPDLTEQSVLEHCNGKLARFKQPKGAAFIDAIPRNPSGKILKRVLRDQFPGPAKE